MLKLLLGDTEVGEAEDDDKEEEVDVEDIDDDVATEGSILQHVESNLKQLRTKFDEEGFLTAVVLMDAAEYGLPQARRQIYIIAIPLDHPMLCSPPMAGLSSKIAILALKLPTHPLDRFLLPDDDEAAPAGRCRPVPPAGGARACPMRRKRRLDGKAGFRTTAAGPRAAPENGVRVGQGDVLHCGPAATGMSHLRSAG